MANEGWTKWFWRSAGLGAGFALTLILLVGVWVWYSSRPKPPKPWNKEAITAKLQKIDISNRDGFIGVEIHYSVQNNTEADYTITGDERFTVLKLDSGEVDQDDGFGKSVKVFIPSKHKVDYDVLRFYTVGTDAPKDASTPDGLNDFLYDEFHNIDAFVLFDEQQRYEILLPSGWKGWKRDPNLKSGLIPKASAQRPQ